MSLTRQIPLVLSYSVIMLNTDLHNPSIKSDRKMKREEFVRNNRGIMDGRDLPESYLTTIYDRIKENDFSQGRR